MNRAQILEEIIVTLSDHLGVHRSNLCESTDLRHDLNTDSLDLVELTMAFEDQYGIAIEDDEIAKITTIGGIADYLNGRNESFSP